jgi:ubiquinol-cytochrome c reductase cytochrome c1 subunit
VKSAPGLHYNPYFANLNLAMPPPLTSEGQVTYADGTRSTVDQMSRDVAAFLVWTAEPKLVNRHSAGIAVVIFLLVASILAYLAYRNIWAEAKRAVRVTGVLEPRNQAKSSRAKRKQGVAG